MSDEAKYTVVKTPVVAPVIKGTTAQVVLNEKTVRAAPFGKITIEHFELASGQDPVAKAFMDACLDDERCMDAERKTKAGENTSIDITWAYDTDDTEWKPGDGDPLWEFDVIDTSQPLAQHPYFGRNGMLSDEDRDALMKEMGRCDQAIALGKVYVAEDKSLSDLVQVILCRYAALRLACVDECTPVLIMVSKRYRVFQSQIESDSGIFMLDINRSVKLEYYKPPAAVLRTLSDVGGWFYEDKTGDPIPVDGYINFSWIKNKPVVKLSGYNPKGPYDVTEYFIGVQGASKVLYPPTGLAKEEAEAAEKAGEKTNVWDPLYNIWGTPDWAPPA